MSAGFTLGPWVVNPFVARVDCERISEKGGLLPVCQMLWPTDERTEDETEANARLIAAAPELYEAMAEFVARVDAGEIRSVLTYNKFKALLAKARGDAA